MAVPAYERVGRALRSVYQAAGLRQEDIARALNVDQTQVSRWARGIQRMDLDYFPQIDRLCGRPLGHLLRVAGYVADEGDVVAAIEHDPDLLPEQKQSLVATYDAFRRPSTPAASAAAEPAKMARRRSSR